MKRGGRQGVAIAFNQGTVGLVAQPPTIMGNPYAPGGYVYIEHREFVADVQMATTTVGNPFQIATLVSAPNTPAAFRINPADARSFPWLSTVAKNFEEYEFEYLRYSLESDMPATQAGGMMMAVDFDVLDAAPSSKVQMSNMQGATKGPSFTSLVNRVDLSCMKGLSKRKYTLEALNNGLYPSQSDAKTYDSGKIFIATFGNGGAPGAAGVGVAELYVEYHLKLWIPQLNNNQGSVGPTTEKKASTYQLLATPTNSLVAGSASGCSASHAFSAQDDPDNNYVGQTISSVLTGDAMTDLTLVTQPVFTTYAPGGVDLAFSEFFGPLTTPGDYQFVLESANLNPSANSGFPTPTSKGSSNVLFAPALFAPGSSGGQMVPLSDSRQVIQQDNYFYSTLGIDHMREAALLFGRGIRGVAFSGTYQLTITAAMLAAIPTIFIGIATRGTRLSNVVPTGGPSPVGWLRDFFFQLFYLGIKAAGDPAPGVVIPQLFIDSDLQEDHASEEAYQSHPTGSPNYFITSGLESVKGVFRLDQVDYSTSKMIFHGIGRYIVTINIDSVDALLNGNITVLGSSTVGYTVTRPVVLVPSTHGVAIEVEVVASQNLQELHVRMQADNIVATNPVLGFDTERATR